MSTDYRWTPPEADEILGAPGGSSLHRSFPRKLVAWLRSQDEVRELQRVGVGMYTFVLLDTQGPIPCGFMMAGQGPAGVGPEVDQRRMAGRDPAEYPAEARRRQEQQG
jgi:hypothetical protein